MKTLAQAVLAAEKIGTKVEKFAALSGLDRFSQQLIVEAYNPYRVYGVKQIVQPTSYAPTDPLRRGVVDYLPFNELLDELCSRDLTGNAARFRITQVLSSYTQETAEVLTRVLTKDLKCGATANSFEKIYPHLKFPRFDLMLAEKIEDSKTHQWKFPCIVETKYDGMRLVAIVSGGTVEYLSRGGKPAEHAEGQFDDELLALSRKLGGPIVVDGEVLGDDFQATVKAKGEKNTAQRSALKFFAFDVMYLSEWQAQSCRLTQTARSLALEETLREIGAVRVVKSDSELCHTYAQALAKYNRIVDAGGEGVIVKNPNGLYEWDRSANWLKWKLVIDLDLEMTGVFEGNGRLKKAGLIGGITLEGKDENGRHIKCECGSGLTDAMRKEIADNVGKYVGRTVKIEAGAVTRAENSQHYAARWPIFVEFRSDK